MRNTTPEKPYQTELINMENIMAMSKSRLSNKTRHKRSKSLVTRQTSAKKNSGISLAEIKKRIKGYTKEKKIKIIPHVPLSIEAKLRRKMTTISKPLVVNKTYTVIGDNSYKTTEPVPKPNETTKADKIIELYHNSAVQMITASEDSIALNKKIKEQTPLIKKSFHIQPFVPKDTHSISTNTHHTDMATNTVMQQTTCTLPMQHHYQRNTAFSVKRTADGASTYSRNYELPTIASKMKQVAKNYFQNFTFRTIPFVVARSTTPSHNLGINIQQVLSIMKGRKPLQGISPTLAYNIELAATKLGSRPFSALVSNLGSRLTSRCMCPAAKRFNFAQLQEQAKISMIPEETTEAFDINCNSSGMYEMNYDNGDKHIQEKSWTVDPQKRKDQCICLPQNGVNFNEVCNKYMDNGKSYVSRFYVCLIRTAF